MTGRLRDGKERFVKTVKWPADKDNYHIPMPDNSFREFRSRQSNKTRMELIATVVAGLIIGAGIIFILLQ